MVESQQLAKVCQEQSDVLRKSDLDRLGKTRIIQAQNMRINDLSQVYMVSSEHEKRATARANEVASEAMNEVTGLRREMLVADEKFKGIVEAEHLCAEGTTTEVLSTPM